MTKKLILVGLLIVGVVSALEIIYYLVFGKGIGMSSGLPSLPDLFAPVTLGQYIMQADEVKTFYPQRLGTFTLEVGTIINSKSSFVKTSEADYIVAGTVASIKSSDDSYDITLKNSSNDTFTEHLSPIEAQYANVSLRNIALDQYSRKTADMTDIKVGDYVAIKRSTNLLNPDEINIDVEILRSTK